MDIVRGPWFCPLIGMLACIHGMIQKNKVEICKVFYDLALEVTQGHFCCIILVASKMKPTQIQGEGRRRLRLMSLWERGKVLEEHVQVSVTSVFPPDL